MASSSSLSKAESSTHLVKETEWQADKEPAPENRKDRPPWLVFSAFLLISVTVLSLLAWSLSSARILFTELLVATAASSIGGLLGFLFGMPRSPVDGPQRDEENKPALTVNYRPSNSLEQVSDWLTKILIGVGLVELTQLSETLSAVGRGVEASLVGAPAGTSVVTQVVVITFLVLGFLTSFLWTRIYYGRLQTLADYDIQDSLRSKLAESEKQLTQEKAKRREAVAVAHSALIGEIATPVAPASKDEAPARSRAVTDFSEWPPDVQEKVEAFRDSPPKWNSNPGAKLFPRAGRESNGRRFEAQIVLDLKDTLVISLRVEQVSGEPLTGEVVFLLHPTFVELIVYADADGEVAETKISSGGWFTAIAIADNGRTILAYDLRELPNAPPWFKRN